MAFVLAGIVMVLTLFGVAMIILADMNAPAPSMTSISPVPLLISGTVVAALLAASHFITIGW